MKRVSQDFSGFRKHRFVRDINGFKAVNKTEFISIAEIILKREPYPRCLLRLSYFKLILASIQILHCFGDQLLCLLDLNKGNVRALIYFFYSISTGCIKITMCLFCFWDKKTSHPFDRDTFIGHFCCAGLCSKPGTL